MRSSLVRIFFLAIGLAVYLSALGVAPRAHAAEGQKIRERLNKIFYWQIADELQVDPRVERQMVIIIEDIQARRESALAARDSALVELRRVTDAAPTSGVTNGANAADAGKGSKRAAKMPNKTAVEPALAAYQRALTSLAGLDNEEYQKLRSLLGPDALARFYVVREGVTKRIREALQAAESNVAPSKSVR